MVSITRKTQFIGGVGDCPALGCTGSGSNFREPPAFRLLMEKLEVSPANGIGMVDRNTCEAVMGGKAFL